MLMGRRSISSLDAMLEPKSDTPGLSPAASTTTLVSDSRSIQSTETDSTADTTSLAVHAFDNHTGHILTHRVVGDKWEEQDMDAVIPVLRSLKFAKD